MKDFIKWLGVNEKVAKVVVWLFIIMVFLIVTNTMLESLGFPYYAITYQNLAKIKVNVILDYIIVYLIAIMNFYAMVLVVFRIKESKSIFKYALLYLIINVILSYILPNTIVQVFIIIYLIVFCFLYSGRNRKYILYAIISYILTVFVQGIWYMSKARFIDYSQLNDTTKSLLSLDYFIIMAIIILVKEIYLRKRSDKKWVEMENQHACSGSANSKTKANSQRKSQKK